MAPKIESLKLSDYPLRTREHDQEDHYCIYRGDLIETGEQYHKSGDFWTHPDCAVENE